MDRLSEGCLSRYFDKVFMKRLSAVECDMNRSHQHELNGTPPLRAIFGDSRIQDRPAYFMWLGGENEGITECASVTWYDAREHHPYRTEYRLYYKANSIMELATEGDLLLVARRPDDSLYFMVAPSGSTIERHLIWLFNIKENIGVQFILQDVSGNSDVPIDFVARYILEELDIEIVEADEAFLDFYLTPFVLKGIPPTEEFSELARRITSGVSVQDDPDQSLLSWLDTEERLFRRLEKTTNAKRIMTVLGEKDRIDVHDFLRLSTSIQHRSKARMEHALEYHLCHIFESFGIRHERDHGTGILCNPNFIFPSISAYKNPEIPEDILTMLGVKYTCKDRWRQVLTEAGRVNRKHLLTLEPGISVNQTTEMQSHDLQLVVPAQLHTTYNVTQTPWLMKLVDFVTLVRKRQSSFDISAKGLHA